MLAKPFCYTDNIYRTALLVSASHFVDRILFEAVVVDGELDRAVQQVHSNLKLFLPTNYNHNFCLAMLLHLCLLLSTYCIHVLCQLCSNGHNRN